jgi:ribosomal protein S18 acetylase RimI-like enzyme
MTGAPIIETLSADEAKARLPDLAALLRACVLDGASLGFVSPFGEEEAAAFWRDKVLPGVCDGTRVLLVARAGDQTVGTVQLGTDTLPSKRHQAEVSKLLVHPDWRRRGLGRALMAAIERRAVALGRSLLVLDTRSGDPAGALYRSIGYMTVGEIPGYCRHTAEDRLEATTVMYKAL